jgi:hypothetical protein
MANDITKAAAFYKSVIGWEPFVAAMGDISKPAKAGERGYTLFMKEGKPVCGGMSLKDADLKGVPAHWFTYIAVDDVDAACKAVTAAGGKVCRPCFDVPGVGRIAIIQDADGAMVGLGTPVRR